MQLINKNNEGVQSAQNITCVMVLTRIPQDIIHWLIKSHCVDMTVGSHTVDFY